MTIAKSMKQQGFIGYKYEIVNVSVTKKETRE